MLHEAFSQVYLKFKLNFYQNVFKTLGDREASLTTVETFCMEIIEALDKPTILEFARFAQMSSPNATYKVQSLIQKGYLNKEQSQTDRREFRLIPTEKYYYYYNISYGYVAEVVRRMEERFSPEDLQKLMDMMEVISGELMPEIPNKLRTQLPPRSEEEKV